MTPLQKAKDAAVKEYIAKRNAAIEAEVEAVEAYKVVQDLYRFEVPAFGGFFDGLRGEDK